MYINQKSNSFNRKTVGEKWDINALETFFKPIKMSKLPVIVSEYEVITDPKKFVKNHLEICKHNNGNSTFFPYYERLLEFKNIIEK